MSLRSSVYRCRGASPGVTSSGSAHATGVLWSVDVSSPRSGVVKRHELGGTEGCGGDWVTHDAGGTKSFGARGTKQINQDESFEVEDRESKQQLYATSCHERESIHMRGGWVSRGESIDDEKMRETRWWYRSSAEREL